MVKKKIPNGNEITKLTAREQGFVKDIAKGKSGTQAAEDNFNMKNKKSAQAYASKLKKKPKVIKRLLSIADSIPDNLLIKKHLELLNKEEVITKNNMTTGEVEIIKTGQIDSIAVKAGLDMAYKLKSSYAPIKTQEIGINESSRERYNKAFEQRDERYNKTNTN